MKTGKCVTLEELKSAPKYKVVAHRRVRFMLRMQKQGKTHTKKFRPKLEHLAV